VTPTASGRITVWKRRPSGPVLLAHVAEAKRRLGSRAKVSEAALVRTLWMTRALPVALDVLADARSPQGLGSARLGMADVLARPCDEGPLLALGWLSSDGRELEVRFLREDDADAPAFAIVVWHLSSKVVDDDARPVIHRFVHGPRR
jgi:hypothetical protein